MSPLQAQIKLFSDNDILVCSDNKIALATQKNRPAQGKFEPLGSALQKYWTTEKYKRAFPKLAKCAETILKWPTVSTMIERGFSEVTAHFTKQGNKIHAETLSDIHQNNRSSVKFMTKLKPGVNLQSVERSSHCQCHCSGKNYY